MSAPTLQGAMVLSILAGLATLLIKTAGWWLTNSVGLLSDAAESLVNLTAAAVALTALRYSARPVDVDHTYGHEKIEFFSAGLEGGLILIAALAIAGFAVFRFVTGEQPEQLGLGMLLSALAAMINCGVGLMLIKLGRKHQSIVLEADGKHLMTDVLDHGGGAAGTGPGLDDPAGRFRPTGGHGDGGQYSLDGLFALAAQLRRLDGPCPARGGARNPSPRHRDQPAARHDLPRPAHPASRRPPLCRLSPAGAGFADRERGPHAFQRHRRRLARALPGVEVTVHIEPIEDAGAWHDSASVARRGSSEVGIQRSEIRGRRSGRSRGSRVLTRPGYEGVG